MRSLGTVAVALILLLGATSASAEENWATARARALTDQGETHRKAGSTDLALARFHEAISIDATYGPAYIALASVREATGETEESLRVLDMALEHIPGFADAVSAQAGLFARARRYREATSSYLHMLTLQPDDEPTLRRLVEVAPRAGLLPVALGAARRLALVAAARGDQGVAQDAKLTSRVLEKLIAEADPVQRGRQARDPVRRALARASSR